MGWTLEQVPNLSGKAILVTGATGGIGLEASRQFVRKGAKLIMASRNEQKMASVAAEFRTESPNAEILCLQLDTSDLDSVRSCVQKFKETEILRIDVLLLNAGMMTSFAPGLSAQGFNLIFATNYLGHWLLTGLLSEFIKEVPGSRIVVVSSVSHRIAGHLPYDKVRDGEYGYNMYNASKLACLMFVTALNKRLEDAEAKAVAVGCHPGLTKSNITHDMGSHPMLKVFKFATNHMEQDTAAGALPLIMASVDAECTKDKYYGPGSPFEIKGNPVSNAHVSSAAKNEEKAKKLWEFTEELTGYKYPF